MSGEEKSTSLDCDVGLGLRTQANESSSSSYPCKRTMVMPGQFAPFQLHQRQFAAAGGGGSGGGGEGGGGGRGGGVGCCGRPLFCSTTNNQVMACVGDMFDVNLGAAAVVSAGAGGGMKAAPFTASQWQELERQTMIYKYLMSSNNVPAELLLPLTKPTSHVSVPQSNTSGLDFKFSSGSDPEPWRCRRTDGKKWRCSRDVAPDQKYCERHAHKSRPRSRKHVETQPHSGTTTTTANNPSQHHLMTSATAYDQNRSSSTMWFIRGGSDTSIPVSTCNQQRRQLQLMQSSSSRMGFSKDNTDYNKNVSVFQQPYEDIHDTISLNPYLYSGGGGGSSSSGPRPLENYQLSGQYYNSFLDPKMASLDDDSTMLTTRHFIDAWSTAERGGGLHEISSNRASLSSSNKKLPLSSLTLSMSGANAIDEDNEQLVKMRSIATTNDDEAEAALKSQWMMSPVSWMNSSAPGGPLGEALCLGIAGNTKGASNLPSPHGYSNSSATSSCSKGSCEDGSHQFNFIG